MWLRVGGEVSWRAETTTARLSILSTDSDRWDLIENPICLGMWVCHGDAAQDA